MHIQKTDSVNFKAGLTRKLVSEISTCRPEKVSTELAKLGIESDFKNDKVVAWCSAKCVEIMKKLNQPLPRGVFLEDFAKLRADEGATGCCNVMPTNLYINSDKIVPEKTIFFNSQFDWSKIDDMADFLYIHGSSSPHFIEPFLHEYSHVTHLNNLINKLGGERYVEKIDKIKQPIFMHNFQKKYFLLLLEICHYATSTPFEAVACDLSKRIINHMPPNSLEVGEPVIKSSPYARKQFSFGFNESKLDKTLRRFWNGNFK